MKTLPLVGWSSRPINCRRVVLPEPEGPTRAVNSPFSTLRSTPRKALVSTSPILNVRVAFTTFVTSILVSSPVQGFDRFHPRCKYRRINRSDQGNDIGRDGQCDCVLNVEMGMNRIA